ncbi:MAG: peptidylprolyl isomerase [Bacteroidota bacterium]
MNKKIRRQVSIALLSLFISFSIAASQPVALDRIVAVVGKEALLLSDLKAQTEFFVLNNHVDPNTPDLQKQVLDGMINEKLLLAKALEDTNITVTDEEVTTELDGVLAQRIQQAGSEKRLEEIYGMPLNRMKREFRDDMRKQLYIRKVQQAKFADVTASRDEVEKFFTQYRDSLPRVPEELELYHIFKIPKVSEGAKNLVKEKAQKILDSIKAGGDFADFAKRYSDDKGSAPGGGDLNFVRRGEFVKEFEEIVFSLKEKELSGLVETPFGIHIIQLLERRGEQVHSRHILFKIPEDSTSVKTTKDYLLALKDSLKAGRSFYDLANKYSDDKETAPVGGLIGRYPITQLDDDIIATTKTLKEGEVSDPVEVASGSAKGYHILYLKRRIPEHTMNLNDDWNRIEQLTVKFNQSTEYQKWLKQLRDEIYWDIRL